MDEAYAVVEVLKDDAGKWADFRFLEVNPAFMQHMPMPYPVGKTATELLGNPNPRWTELYGEVLDSGKALRVEEPESTLGRTFDLNIFSLDRENNRVAVLFTNITERKRAEEALRASERHAQLLLTELQHRVRNTLAVVRSIARRTAETTTSAEEMLAHFQGRLDAFSRVQAALTRNPDARISLTSLIQDELVAHAARDGEQIRIEGPEIELEPWTAERFSLAIHELATNAVKHGALVGHDGRIHIRWAKQPNGGGDELRLSWTESGVEIDGKQLEREGFGMEMLRRSLPYDLQAETQVELRPDGLHFEMSMPLSKRHPSAGRQ
jgi:two-component system CheB/CheR fusion protein